jgi:hypothetical protein
MDTMEAGQQFKVQAMSRVCFSLHYGIICMGLFKLEKKAKRES